MLIIMEKEENFSDLRRGRKWARKYFFTCRSKVTLTSRSVLSTHLVRRKWECVWACVWKCVHNIANQPRLRELSLSTSRKKSCVQAKASSLVGIFSHGKVKRDGRNTYTDVHTLLVWTKSLARNITTTSERQGEKIHAFYTQKDNELLVGT